MNKEEHILKNEILNTIGYFSYFNHALSLEEVQKYLGTKVEIDNLRIALNTLVSDNILHEKNGFYAQNIDTISSRIKYTKRNRNWLRTAHHIGKLVAHFPFVQSVFISGSLSKQGLKGKNDDIDFFLIVAPNRVWTAKLFLILFKKIMLLNSHKYFCINLIRDERYLVFDRKNIYIATEIVSLIPVGRATHWHPILVANKWIYDFFPNQSLPESIEVKSTHNFTDSFLSLFIGPRFEEWCRKRFEKHVQKHQNQKDSYFELSPQSSAYFPNNFQGRVLRHYHAIRNHNE